MGNALEAESKLKDLEAKYNALLESRSRLLMLLNDSTKARGPTEEEGKSPSRTA
jgi:hypothetical protein